MPRAGRLQGFAAHDVAAADQRHQQRAAVLFCRRAGQQHFGGGHAPLVALASRPLAACRGRLADRGFGYRTQRGVRVVMVSAGNQLVHQLRGRRSGASDH